tara:strand:+ start:497 stop:1414 length:918 start_codon:yes stop_codon:yes gene_type:complete
MKYLLIILFSSIVLSACEFKEKKATKGEKLKIVCTTGMLGDAVKNIVKNQAEVSTLMGPGVDPHLYKATQGDLKILSDADIIIYNGLHLEGKMGEVFEKLKNRKTIIVAADGINKADLINTTEFQGAYDPHLWFDVDLWNRVVQYIGEKLSKLEQIDKNQVLENSKNFQNALSTLNDWVKSEIQKIAPERRVLITAHDAFGYFGRAYDIEVRGLQGISTVSEYGLKDVSDLVNFITERKIKAVFVESSVSARSLNAVVEGCKSNGHPVKIGGTLYSDAMGEAGTAEGTYIGMVKYNVSSIVENLK